MRILPTGARGFIGQHLLAEGRHVVCAMRRPGTSTASAASACLATIQADFAHDTDESAWLARLSGIDVVTDTVGILRASGSRRPAST